MSYIFGGNTNLTPEQIRQRRDMAQALMGQAAAPRNVGEGIFSAASSIAGALMQRQANKSDTANRKEYESGTRSRLMDALTGRRQSEARGTSFNPAGAVAGATGGAARSAAGAAGGPAGMAVGSVEDRDLLARTLMAEAGGEGLEGMLAAGAVINNRVGAGGYGDSLRDVIMKPGQFSAWNSVTGYAGGEGGLDMDRMNPSPEALQAADMLLSGQYEDPTGGATHYYNPAAADPKWGQRAGGDWQRIGNHVFGNADAGRGGQRPQQQQQGGDQVEIAMSVLNSPYASEADKQMAAMILQRATAQPEPMSEMEQVQLERERLELDQLRNPRPEPTAQDLPPEMIAQLGLPEGTVAQRAPDGGIEVIYQPEAPEQPDPTTRQREYEQAVAQGYQGTLMDYQREIAEASRAQTNVNVNSGSEVGTIPQGYELVTDPQTGARSMRAIPGGPEDASGEQASAAMSAQDSIALVDAVLNDPNLGAVTGMIEGRLPARNQQQQDLMVRVEQLQGQAFLQAFETLKGGGQITEREGQAAQAAIARLQRVQSEEAYREALTELRSIMQRGLERAQGGTSPANAPAAQDQGAPSATAIPIPRTPSQYSDEQWQRIWENMPDDQKDLFR